MNRDGLASPSPAPNWTRAAPKFAAALTLLTLASAGLTLSLARGAGPAISAPAISAAAHRIDLNSATAAELESLPAIGPRRAQAILADRRERGPFGSIEDLDRVPGIGKGTIERIREYITVAPASPAPAR